LALSDVNVPGIHPSGKKAIRILKPIQPFLVSFCRNLYLTAWDRRTLYFKVDQIGLSAVVSMLEKIGLRERGKGLLECYLFLQ
jgi:hypothetical protein